MKNILFSFDDLSSKDKAVKALQKQFGKEGVEILKLDVDSKIRRTSNLNYREVTLFFVDSQQVTLRIAQSGDVYQVLVNGKIIPIANQDDHGKAVSEIVAVLNRGRAAYQEKLAKAKVALPEGIKTAAVPMEKALTRKRDDLKVAVAAAEEELATIRAA